MAGKSVVVAILADTKNFASGMDSASQKASGFSSVLGGVGKAVAIGLAAAGAAAVGFLAVSVKAAGESQKVAAQTEAVLNSTGGAAGRTAAQIGDLASKLSMLSGVDDEVIQSGQNVLLTFTKIQGANFDRATEAALNMSVALGTDLNAASILVGKALNDPIKGMSALSRAGVQLTADQRDLIEQMVKVGDVAGAQNVLLQELTTQFGGSAEAYGRTFEGALSRVQTIFGNLQETVGGALLPALTLVLGKVADFLGAIQESEAFNTFITNMTAFANGLLDGSASLGSIGDLIVNGIQSAADWLAGGGIQTIVESFISGRAALFDAAMQVFPALVEALVSIVPQILTGLTTVITSLVSMLVTSLPTLVTAALQLFLGIVQGIAAALPEIVTALVGLIPVLVTTIVGMVPSILSAAITLFQTLIDAVVTTLPVLLEQIVAMLPGIIEALISLIPQLIEGAISLFMSLVNAIPIILPMLIQTIVDLIPILIETILTLIPTLLDAAISLFTALIDAIPVILPLLIDTVVNLVPQIVSSLVAAAPKLLDAGGKLFGKLIDAGKNIVPMLLGVGKNIVQGLWDGVTSAWSGFKSWWDKTVSGVVDTVKSIFGIRSPSRVFAGIGVNVVKGLEQGLAGPNRLGSIMAGLGADVEGSFSASLEAPTGYRAAGAGAGTTVVVQLPVGMPDAAAGRAIVDALEAYSRAGGVVQVGRAS